MSESETVAKNRIEFQWGSKLQGTSSEALVVTGHEGQLLKHAQMKLALELIENI